MGSRFLYRGVNADMHRLGKGVQPKQQGPFEYSPPYGDPEAPYGSGWTYGKSGANAVVRHQLHQAGHPTSGVSTTPVFGRAVVYATHCADGGQCQVGYVYKIDRCKLQQHGVTEFVVAAYTVNPSVPEDEEVILVGLDNGPLPQEVIVEVLEVASHSPSNNALEPSTGARHCSEER